LTGEVKGEGEGKEEEGKEERERGEGYIYTSESEFRSRRNSEASLPFLYPIRPHFSAFPESDTAASMPTILRKPASALAFCSVSDISARP
jgi:hypothetical protein